MSIIFRKGIGRKFNFLKSGNKKFIFAKTLAALADIYSDYVTLLLYMNGTNGSTTFTDSSANNFTISSTGNTSLSTSVKKYGSASAYFDGSGDYLQTTISNWNPGVNNEPFTIEFWVYRLTSGIQVFISKHGGVDTWNSTNGINFNFYYTGTTLIFQNWGNNTTETTQCNINLPVNEWIHLAVVYNGTNTVIYVNGISCTTSSVVYSAMSSANTLEVGAQCNGNYPFNGYIDDLRITIGVPRYTANFTPPQQQLPDPSDPYQDNVSLLLHMDGTNGSQTFVDSSSNNFTLSAFGNAQISTSVKKFGNGSVYFNGTSDYLTLSATDAFNFFNTDYTVEMWVYSTASQTGGGLISTRLAAVYSPWELQITSANKIGFLIRSGASSWYLNGPVAGNTTIPQNQWTHIAWVRNGSNTTVYINGIADSNLTNLNTPILQAFAQPSNIFIGKGGDGDFNGYIDDLRVTKGVARYTSNFVPHTAPFVNPTVKIPPGYLAFWKLADLTDSSPNGNTLTNNSSVQFVAGKVGNCAQFNGTNNLQDSSLSSPFNPNGPAGEFTISIWINPASFSNYQAFLGSTTSGFIIHLDAAGNLYCNEAGSGDAQINGILQLNQWQHIVFVKSVASGNRTKVWYNGTKVYDQPTNNNGNYQSKTNITLGNFGDLIFPYNGKLDMVGLWNRELTQSEIDLLYNSGNGREP